MSLINYALNGFKDVVGIEIHKNSHPLIHEPKICEKLFCKYFLHLLDRFKFNYNLIFYNDVKSQFSFLYITFVCNWYLNLSFHLQTSLFQLKT